ncbi:MAG: proteasome accessory factor PafA2 family protein [Candidatus Aenigmarchaeota archaeon]|nr:proteasome accessory factor PafA2 family protein [Candidatus Aenigmarchaeota archaeon]
MKPRIFGIETEYGVLSPNMREERLTTRLSELFYNRFLSNGARLYFDIGDHPEYCTPETSNPRDVVLYDRAGELIVLKEAQKENIR